MKERGDIYLSDEARLRSLRDELEREYGVGRKSPTPAQVQRTLRKKTFEELEPHYQPTEEDKKKKYNARKIRDNHEGKSQSTGTS